MPQIFVVTRAHGPAWIEPLPPERQPDWEAHRSFMNELEADGFVRLGGPLEGARAALLIVVAETLDEARARLEPDPWSATGHLVTARIACWDLRIGEI